MIEKYKNDFFRDITSFGGTYFYIILLVFIFLLGEVRTFKILLIGFLVTYIISFLIRLFYFKERPNKESYANFIMKMDASSFPSVHSMRAIFIAIVLAKVFDNFYIKTLFMVIALLVAYSRIYIKKHYLVDVIVGLAIGLMLALVILRII